MKKIEEYVRSIGLVPKYLNTDSMYKVNKGIKIEFDNCKIAVIQLKNNHYRMYKFGDINAKHKATTTSCFIDEGFKQVEIIEMFKKGHIQIY